MAFNENYCMNEDWFGQRTLATTADANGWAYVKVGSGSPTAITLDGAPSGALRMLCTNTSEVQSITAYHKDTLGFDIDTLKNFRIKLNLAAGGDATTACFYGMTGDHNATLASIAERVGFVVGASGAISVVTDDGSTDSGDISTGYTLGTSDYVLEVDLTNKSDVKFYIHDGVSSRRVARNTTFTMAAYSGCLQPYLRTGRGEGSATLTVDVDQFKINGCK